MRNYCFSVYFLSPTFKCGYLFYCWYFNVTFNITFQICGLRKMDGIFYLCPACIHWINVLISNFKHWLEKPLSAAFYQSRLKTNNSTRHMMEFENWYISDIKAELLIMEIGICAAYHTCIKDHSSMCFKIIQRHDIRASTQTPKSSLQLLTSDFLSKSHNGIPVSCTSDGNICSTSSPIVHDKIRPFTFYSLFISLLSWIGMYCFPYCSCPFFPRIRIRKWPYWNTSSDWVPPRDHLGEKKNKTKQITGKTVIAELIIPEFLICITHVQNTAARMLQGDSH